MVSFQQSNAFTTQFPRMSITHLLLKISAD